MAKKYCSRFFVEYLFYIKNHNGIPVIAKTDEKFFPDLSDLSKKITKNTKGIIINSPNNPTGWMMNKKEQQEILEMCRKNNVWVMVYRAEILQICGKGIQLLY